MNYCVNITTANVPLNTRNLYTFIYYATYFFMSLKDITIRASIITKEACICWAILVLLSLANQPSFIL